MTILELAESFKMMNGPDQAQPGPIWPDPTVTLFDSIFLGNYNIERRGILTQPLFKSSTCAIKLWDSLETM